MTVEEVQGEGLSPLEQAQKAGRVACAVVRAVRHAAEPGITTRDLDELARQILLENGAIALWLARFGFVLSVNVNEQLFGYPPSDRVLEDGDLVTLFVPVGVGEGYAAKAVTFPVGNCTEAARRVGAAPRRAMQRAVATARPEAFSGDVSHAMSQVIGREGLGVALEYDLRNVLTASNYLVLPGGFTGTGRRLMPGMTVDVIAASSSSPVMRDTVAVAGFPAYRCRGRTYAALFAHTLFISDQGALVLTHDPEDELDEHALSRTKAGGGRRRVLRETDRIVEYQIGGLTWAKMRPPEPPCGRVLTWHRTLTQMGIDLPLFLVNDVGLLLSRTEGAGVPQASLAELEGRQVGRYGDLLERLARHGVVGRIRMQDPDDRTLALLVARLLMPAAEGFAGAVDMAYDFDPVLLYRLMAHDLPWQDGAVRTAAARAKPVGPKRFLPPEILDKIEDNLEGLTFEAYRFLESFAGAETLDFSGLVDLLHVVGLEGAGQIIVDAMSIVPDLGRSSRSGSEQYTSIDGYAGVANRGSFDALVPTELAYPRDAFYQRYVDKELLFFSHERPPMRKRELFLVVCHAGLAMKGDPDLLARSLSVALSRKLVGKPCDVSFCFFDEDLGEPFRLSRPGDYYRLLTHRSDRGTRLARVVASLAKEIDGLAEGYARCRILIVSHVHLDEFGDHVSRFNALSRKAELTAVLIGPEQYADVRTPLQGAFRKLHVIPYEILQSMERRRSEAGRVLIDLE